MVVKYCRNGVVCKFNLEDLLVHLGGCILNPIFLFVSVFISKIAQKQVKNRFQSNWEENIRPPPPHPQLGVQWVNWECLKDMGIYQTGRS